MPWPLGLQPLHLPVSQNQNLYARKMAHLATCMNKTKRLMIFVKSSRRAAPLGKDPARNSTRLPLPRRANAAEAGRQDLDTSLRWKQDPPRNSMCLQLQDRCGVNAAEAGRQKLDISLRWYIWKQKQIVTRIPRHHQE